MLDDADAEDAVERVVRPIEMRKIRPHESCSASFHERVGHAPPWTILRRAHVGVEPDYIATGAAQVDGERCLTAPDVGADHAGFEVRLLNRPRVFPQSRGV